MRRLHRAHVSTAKGWHSHSVACPINVQVSQIHVSASLMKILHGQSVVRMQAIPRPIPMAGPRSSITSSRECSTSSPQTMVIARTCSARPSIRSVLVSTSTPGALSGSQRISQTEAAFGNVEVDQAMSQLTLHHRRFPSTASLCRFRLPQGGGSCWVAVSDQSEKNRSVKKALLEKEGHHAHSNARFP